MAAIVHNRLAFEIRYQAWEHGWVVYNIAYTWNGDPIFNDAVMKRQNEHWDNRGPGEIHANEHAFCCFIPLLEKVIETQTAAYVTTIDPDVTLAIWPHDTFPFMPSNDRIIYESPETQSARADREKSRREAGGILPSDFVELMLFIDTYNFSTSGPYSGECVCLKIQPTWAELRLFLEALKSEFRTFAKQNRIVEYVEADHDSLPETWAWLKS